MKTLTRRYPLSIENKLLEIQKNLPTLRKSAENPHFRNSYVPLEVVMEEVLPVLNAVGILLLQAPSNVDGQAALTTTLVDTEDGSKLVTTVPLVLDKQTPQAVGSAVTYMRRYSLMSILGLVGEPDTDAEAAMERTTASVRAPKGTRASSARSTTTPEF